MVVSEGDRARAQAVTEPVVGRQYSRALRPGPAAPVTLAADRRSGLLGRIGLTEQVRALAARPLQRLLPAPARHLGVVAAQ